MNRCLDACRQDEPSRKTVFRLTYGCQSSWQDISIWMPTPRRLAKERKHLNNLEAADQCMEARGHQGQSRSHLWMLVGAPQPSGEGRMLRCMIHG
jgi:hypothetical protein